MAQINILMHRHKGIPLRRCIFFARDHSLDFHSYGLDEKRVTANQFSVIITIKSACDFFDLADGPKMEIPNQSSYEKMVLNEVSDI